jgi:hypothetical protein
VRAHTAPAGHARIDGWIGRGGGGFHYPLFGGQVMVSLSPINNPHLHTAPFHHISTHPPTHLVRHVPDDAVVRGVEHVVEGDRQLDHAERGAQVAARLRDVAQRVPPQLVRQLLQLLLWLLSGDGGRVAVVVGR